MSTLEEDFAKETTGHSLARLQVYLEAYARGLLLLHAAVNPYFARQLDADDAAAAEAARQAAVERALRKSARGSDGSGDPDPPLAA
jgi:hypothetical protein